MTEEMHLVAVICNLIAAGLNVIWLILFIIWYHPKKK